ncbi:hypothetical protein [Streptomyces sp. NPDC101166]|uniref:hypothetical protein n=1 Tax=Streptomyces sp. NPDC101166 TaxID=3366120 RepID=UPI00381A9339
MLRTVELLRISVEFHRAYGRPDHFIRVADRAAYEALFLDERFNNLAHRPAHYPSL